MFNKIKIKNKNQKIFNLQKKEFLGNKKATQSSYMVTWTYRIVAIVLIVMGFIAILWIRFSQPYDIRPLEAAVIAKKSIECLSQDQMITNSTFNKEKLKGCLDLDEENIFLIMKFQGKNVTLGRDTLEMYCKTANVEMKYKPFCYEQNYDVLDENQKLDEINVFIALDKSGKNVK